MPLQKSHTILDKMSPSDKERFWSKVDIRSEEECWEWKDSLAKNGYGRLNVCGKNGIKLPAHRIAKTLSMGEEIEEGMVVMHTCDNRPCCNPSHLEIGTQQDNMDDMVSKNRSVVSFGAAILDWDIVDDIRTSNLTGNALSKKYNTAKSNISMIRNNLIWKEENRDKAKLPEESNLISGELIDDGYVRYHID